MKDDRKENFDMKVVAACFLTVFVVLLFFAYRFFDIFYHAEPAVLAEPSNAEIATSVVSPATQSGANVVNAVSQPVTTQGLADNTVSASLNSGSSQPALKPVKKVAPVAPPKAAPKPVPPSKVLVSLYPSNKGNYPVFTTLEKNKEIVVYQAGPEWTEVISAKGMPVWVNGDLVKQVSNGYVEVVVNRANARSVPKTQASAVLGSLERGEILRVSRKKDGWFRVWSPIRFRAWVKTKELRRV